MPHISEDSAKVCKRSSPAEENGRGAVRWDMIGKDLGGSLPTQRMERDTFGAPLGCTWDISPQKRCGGGERAPYSNALFSLRAMAVRLSCAEERMLAVPHS